MSSAQCRGVQGSAGRCRAGRAHAKTSKKWVSSGGGLGGSGPKTHWGMRLLDKIMILQGVKLTIQPLGVGYANRPKKVKMGGYVAFSPYIRLPGFDLTTSAR